VEGNSLPGKHRRDKSEYENNQASKRHSLPTKHGRNDKSEYENKPYKPGALTNWKTQNETH
jgi:hypothetical protein